MAVNIRERKRGEVERATREVGRRQGRPRREACYRVMGDPHVGRCWRNLDGALVHQLEDLRFCEDWPLTLVAAPVPDEELLRRAERVDGNRKVPLPARPPLRPLTPKEAKEADLLAYANGCAVVGRYRLARGY